MKSYIAKPADIKRDWYVVDVAGKTVGRVATEIASRLRGKNKPEYTPFVDVGDYIIVINAAKVTLTGNKAEKKVYHHHTGFPGGIVDQTFKYDRINAAASLSFVVDIDGDVISVPEHLSDLFR